MCTVVEVRNLTSYFGPFHIFGAFVPTSRSYVSPDSSVGIATQCGLDGPGIESR